MRVAVPEFFAEVSDATLLEVKQSKTDKKDVEILAAAIDSGSSVLVTYNLKDFDIQFSQGKNISILHPDDFLSQLIETQPGQAIYALELTAQRLSKPSMTARQYCLGLAKNNLKKSVVLFESLLP